MRASLFRNVAWICKEVLIAAGNTSLKNNKGKVEDLATKEQVKKWMLRSQVARPDLGGERSAEEAEGLVDFLRRARRHPNVALNLANMEGHAHYRVRGEDERPVWEERDERVRVEVEEGEVAGGGEVEVQEPGAGSAGVAGGGGNGQGQAEAAEAEKDEDNVGPDDN